MRYRIISDGDDYKPQRRYFGFLWMTLRNGEWPAVFKSHSLAMDYIHEYESRRNRPKYEVITDITTPF